MKSFPAKFEMKLGNAIIPNTKSNPSNKAIIIAEKHHAERYGKLLKLVGDDAFFKRGKKVVWICMECGYEVEMDELPKDWKCPSCNHPRANFRIKCEEF